MSALFDEILTTPVLIVGAGVAGLSTALALDGCTVLTKCPIGEGGSTAWAQGGVAAAVDPNDTAEDHAKDTIKAGGGIVDCESVEQLTQGGRTAIQRLIKFGAHFDRNAAGELALSREGGHGRRRVVHSEGDATGQEILRTLTAAAQRRQDIRIVQGSWAVDLAKAGDRVVGAVALDSDGRRTLFLSPAVVLATGGAGRIYLKTTNPPEATGDGIAMAIRAGAMVADMEFVQFHPTALDANVDPLPLITEALRGEGAALVNREGARFMKEQHPDAELAPRDLVARAIWRELESGRGAFLDARKVLQESPMAHFALCRKAAEQCGLDPEKQPLPVSPAAHYFIGGIAVDKDGRSSLPGLWAVGEASSTGVHGANRLASNSLLEGMVFGPDVAKAILEEALPSTELESIELPQDCGLSSLSIAAGAVRKIRSAMWHKVGLVRDERSLQEALSILESAKPECDSSLEARNLWIVAQEVTLAALARRESRGTHFRSDYPKADPALARRSFRTNRPKDMIEFCLREKSVLR